jgi:DNA polymerase III alpha subunit
MIKTNSYSELVFDSDDLSDLILQGKSVDSLRRVTIDPSVDLESLIQVLEDPAALLTWTFPDNSNRSVPDYDTIKQSKWHMPEQYCDIDIAAHVLSLCSSDAELQRVGQELMLYQERGLFDLLRYLKYLVDLMTEHSVIWGVGRGSSVSSYVLYLLGVHRIDSMFYDLDIHEFLR